jgi:hypothetical protein
MLDPEPLARRSVNESFQNEKRRLGCEAVVEKARTALELLRSASLGVCQIDIKPNLQVIADILNEYRIPWENGDEMEILARLLNVWSGDFSIVNLILRIIELLLCTTIDFGSSVIGQVSVLRGLLGRGSSSRARIIAIFANLLTETQKIFKMCVKNGVDEILLDEFESLSDENADCDPNWLILIDSVAFGLRNLGLFPQLLSLGNLSRLVSSYIKIMSNRELFDSVLDMALTGCINLIRSNCFDSNMIVESGIYSKVVSILKDDYSVSWSDCFYLLGLVSEIVDFDLIDLSLRVLRLDGFEIVFPGFCYFLSNVFTINSEPLDALNSSGFFRECLGRIQELPFEVKKEFCELVSTAMAFSNENGLMRLWENGVITFLFDFLEVGDSEMKIRCAFGLDLLFRKVHMENLGLTGFLEVVLGFLEGMTLMELSEDIRNVVDALVDRVARYRAM